MISAYANDQKNRRIETVLGIVLEGIGSLLQVRRYSGFEDEKLRNLVLFRFTILGILGNKIFLVFPKHTGISDEEEMPWHKTNIKVLSQAIIGAANQSKTNPSFLAPASLWENSHALLRQGVYSLASPKPAKAKFTGVGQDDEKIDPFSVPGPPAMDAIASQPGPSLRSGTYAGDDKVIVGGPPTCSGSLLIKAGSFDFCENSHCQNCRRERMLDELLTLEDT